MALHMRKEDAAATAGPASRAPDSRDSASVQLVCLALVLALVALACRIVSIW
jgi:hypothetical protein